MSKFIKSAFLCLLGIFMFFLVSCIQNDNTLTTLVNQLELEYAIGDTKDSITKDFDLPSSIGDATILWTSSNDAVIEISEEKAIVNRQTTNTTVVLNAKLTLNNASLDKDFSLIVLALEDEEVYYTITWIVDEVSSTTKVLEGELPVKENPTKDGYTFKNWDPQIVVATKDTTYTAVFEENEPTSSIKEELNAAFGFDIYSLIPEIVSDDYLIVDDSDEDYICYYVDIFTWSEADVDEYIEQLDLMLQYDSNYDEWLVLDYYIFVYYDDATYDDGVYGICIYKEKTPGTPTSSIKDELNDIFGVDIYSLIPEITSGDYGIFDESDDVYFDIYIDLFDWDSAKAASYEEALNQKLDHDSEADAYKVLDYYILIYLEDEVYDEPVWSIRIYKELNPSTPTTSIKDELNDILGFDIYSLIPEIISDDYLILDESDEDYIIICIDILSWTEDDAIDYIDQLDLMLQYDSDYDEWLVSGYYIYVYYDDETYDDVVYGICIYKEKNPSTPTTSIKDELNDILGFDFYSLIPNINSNDYSLFEENDDDYDYVIIELFDWIESNANNYVSALDQIYDFDGDMQALVVNGYFIRVYLDTKSYEEPVYCIEIIKPANTEEPAVEYDVTFQAKDRVNTGIPEGLINSYLTINNQGTATINVSYVNNNATVSSIFNNESGEIRLYPQSGNGGQLTFTISEGFSIKAIIIEFAGNAGLSINGSSPYTGTSTINHVFSNGQMVVTLKNVANATSKNRVDIELITITYVKEGTNEPPVELQDGTATTLTNIKTLNEWQLGLNTQYSGIPSVGDIDVLVIPIEIFGSPFASNYANVLDLLFNGPAQSTGWQSVSSYYSISSNGKLNLNFDIAQKYVTSDNKEYFEQYGEYLDEYIIFEAIMALDPTIDFSKYDYNNDGLIDGIVFVYSVEYDYDLSWWAWVFDAYHFEDENQIPTLDGLSLGYYMWVSYEFAFDQIGGAQLVYNAETYIHEFGHLLGQTDLYTSDQNKWSGPLGDWDMMDYNAGDHGPFTKLLFGWVEPLLATSGYKYQIDLDSYSSDTDGIDSVILIPRSNANFTDGDVFDEYLLIIFYTPEGLYEGHLNSAFGVKNAGVVIYHVDARLANDYWYWSFFLNNNDGNSNFLVQILEADKNNSIPSNLNDENNISQSDFLMSGTLDLSSYYWNQGGSINVVITIDSIITNDASYVSLTVEVS